MIFITSDQHFNHRRVIEFCRRPFTDVADMNAEMIVRWNRRVRPNDTVYHLGDFGWNRGQGIVEHCGAILKRLNGRVTMLRGNHDYPAEWTKPGYPDPFIKDQIVEVRWEKRFFVLCHYPLADWPRRFHGAAHLHGHVHDRVDHIGVVPNRFNVSADVTAFAPIAIEEIIGKIVDVQERPREIEN